MEKYSETVELCRKLISIPSVNPQSQRDYDKTYGEKRLINFITNWLSENDITHYIQRINGDRCNIIAQGNGKDTSRKILLCAHMDTVDIKSMTIKPFTPDIVDGRLYGRGSCDDKGPLAAMLIAFRNRIRKGNLPCNIELLATCDEEYDMSGSKFAASEYSGNIETLVIGEPTALDIIIAHKGVARITITTHGKSAHSSNPKLGNNAIYSMAKIIQIIEDHALNVARKHSTSPLGNETLAITTITGGQQINIIPEKCQIQIDWRVLPDRKGENCIIELKTLLENKGIDNIELELMGYFDAVETDQLNKYITLMKQACQKHQIDGKSSVVSYATDGSSFAKSGIPTIVFGPGNIKNAHTNDEYIDINQLEKATVIYQEFLDSI